MDFSEFETTIGGIWRIGWVCDYWAKPALAGRVAATATATDLIASLEAAIAAAEELLGHQRRHRPLARRGLGSSLNLHELAATFKLHEPGDHGTDVTAMRRAVALSALGLGMTSPNPPVGCVIVSPDGAIVGEGYHERKGGPHAERYALDAAGERTAGATAYVTLEPCCHHGRTPPCHQALIDADVARVVIAALDPTSRGVGGAVLLRDAGVKVDVGLLNDEALVVLGAWLEALDRNRPRVIWAYRHDGRGVRPLADAALAGLRAAVDVVVGDDFAAMEGVPGRHGAFRIPHLRAEDGPLAALQALYRGGARSVLLAGGQPLGESFVAAGLVDEVRVWFSTPTAGSPAAPAPVVPLGFRVRAVQPFSGSAVIEAVTAG